MQTSDISIFKHKIFSNNWRFYFQTADISEDLTFLFSNIRYFQTTDTLFLNLRYFQPSDTFISKIKWSRFIKMSIRQNQAWPYLISNIWWSRFKRMWIRQNQARPYLILKKIENWNSINKVLKCKEWQVGKDIIKNYRFKGTKTKSIKKTEGR